MKRMENNNGRGIFYGVIGVATLIVAIIGATFAYFSASVRSNNNAITAGATVLSLNLSQDTSKLKTNLIPVEADGATTNTAYGAENAEADATVFPNFPTADGDRGFCQDLLGNNICSIYTFTVNNPNATASQQIYGFLTVETNEFQNLKYAVFKGTADDVATQTATMWNVRGTDPTADGNGNYDVGTGMLVRSTQAVPLEATTDETAPAIPGMTVTLAPNDNAAGGDDEVTYTILLWIEETGGDQTLTDSKKDDGSARTFAGGVLINTSGGGNGVTGTLRLAS